MTVIGVQLVLNAPRGGDSEDPSRRNEIRAIVKGMIGAIAR